MIAFDQNSIAMAAYAEKQREGGSHEDCLNALAEVSREAQKLIFAQILTKPVEEQPKSNIIPFPKERMVRQVTVADHQKEMEVFRLNHMDIVSEEALRRMMLYLLGEGVAIMPGSPGYTDLLFVLEAIRSALYKHHGLPHELQDFVKDNFYFDNNVNPNQPPPEIA